MGLILIGFTPFTFETGSLDQTIGSLLGAGDRLRRRRDLLRQAAPPARDRRLLRLSRSRSTARSGSASRARRGRGVAIGERNPEKQAKAEERFRPDRRTERFKNAFRDIVGGKPSEGVAAATEEVRAAGREAVEEVRQGVGRITHPPEDRRED